jgi:tRNA (Thr-GGU) A37 N-methylase
VEFSHVEVVYVFDRVDPSSFELGVRRPRNNPDWPEVGVFAQRNKRRRNRIGLGTCELLSVSGLGLTVRGLDPIDGTPVLVIKPYMAEFAPRGPSASPLGRTSTCTDTGNAGIQRGGGAKAGRGPSLPLGFA